LPYPSIAAAIADIGHAIAATDGGDRHPDALSLDEAQCPPLPLLITLTLTHSFAARKRSLACRACETGTLLSCCSFSAVSPGADIYRARSRARIARSTKNLTSSFISTESSASYNRALQLRVRCLSAQTERVCELSRRDRATRREQAFERRAANGDFTFPRGID